MNASILHFPLAKFSTDDRSAAAMHLRRALTTFEIAEASADPARAYAMATQDIEAALFHAATHSRDPDHDLRNHLNRRAAAREEHHARS